MFTVVTSNRRQLPESSALLVEKVTGDGEDGLCLSNSPAESVAALQEIAETPGVMVHLQVRGAVSAQSLSRREKNTAVTSVCSGAKLRAKLTARLTVSQVTHCSFQPLQLQNINLVFSSSTELKQEVWFNLHKTNCRQGQFQGSGL